MEGRRTGSQRLREVEDAFGSLPDRYLGGEEGRRATVQIRLADVGRTWEVELREHHCKVRPSARAARLLGPPRAVAAAGALRLG